MFRALRILIALSVTLTITAASVGQASHTRAATKQVLTVTYADPIVDPALYLNAKTKSTAPANYARAVQTQKLLNAFYRIHPDYTVQFLNYGWSDVLRQKILLKVAAGLAPDVIVGEDFIPEFARLGVLSPLPSSLMSVLAPGPASGGVYNGKLYAIPCATGIFELFYNKALFRKAGLNPNNPPKTWDEWLTDSKKIAALGNGISGTTVEANTGLGAAYRLAPFLRQMGGDFATQDGATITFNTPANVKALTFLRQLAQTAAPGVTSIVDEGKFFTSTWWAGKAGFVVEGPWDIQSSQQFHLDFGVAPLPVGPGGHPANVIVGSTLYGVTKLSQHQQAAVDFVTLLARYDIAKGYYDASGRLPAVTSVLNKVVVRQGYPINIFATGIQQPNITPLPVYAANTQKVWSTWYDAQLAALATSQPIAQILSTAQSTAEGLLQQ